MEYDPVAPSDDHLRLLAICNYPSDTRPALQVFVRALLIELHSLGVDVTVIAPEPLANRAKLETGFRLAPTREERDGLQIHRPRFASLSAVSLPFGMHTARWGADSYLRAVLRQVERTGDSYDLTFGHFLYPHARAAAEAGERLGIPAVASLGESSFDRYESVYDQQEIGRLLDRFAGVITNSDLIRDYCVERFGLDEGKAAVFPNGVNQEVFAPIDQAAARRRLGLPLDRPIVISVGQFIERKGPLRILEAIRPRPEIGAVFLGSGPQEPAGAQVLFKGSVKHEEVPTWLSAADMFVLPTLDEGCSNAILEALFCGLPIISSDLPFNHSILNEEVSMLVDPLDVQEIQRAVFSLIDDSARRDGMRQAALEYSRSFRLNDRAQRVLAFLQARLSDAKGRV
jgi:glycosyltransferase involved in cell wall biosynthesis